MPTDQAGKKFVEQKAEPLLPLVTSFPLSNIDNKEVLAANNSGEIIKSTADQKESKKAENVIRYHHNDNLFSIKELVKSPFKVTKLVAARGSGDDGRSLIWVLIVILLVIYIAGLLLDTFGLGGLFHILGVIILVLLLLWLLRVI